MGLISRFLLVAATAAALVSFSVAEAADKPRSAASAPRSKDAVMSQAQLRECLSQKEKLGQRNDAALKTKADIGTVKAEIDRAAEEIATAQATLDRTKKEEVDAFNEKIVARNALIDDYQAKAAVYNKDAEEIKASQESYSTNCGNRRYDDRDLADIQHGKK